MWTWKWERVSRYTGFFRIALSHESLYNYMHTNFAMMQHYRYSLSELESMIPWEREVYVELLLKYIKDENKRIQEEKNKMKY